MGATTFSTVAKGATASEAFYAAVESAKHDHGHTGYTGTIAEKDDWTVIVPPAEHMALGAEALAGHYIDNDDERIVDKWGPAGCVDLGNGWYVFFGYASC